MLAEPLTPTVELVAPLGGDCVVALDRPSAAVVLLLEGTGTEDTVVARLPRSSITLED